MQKLHELTIELTDFCPSECLHCSSSSGPNNFNYLKEDTAMHLVEEAALLGAKVISFGGGEPTCSKIFIKVLRQVVDLNLAAEIFTCGFSSTSGKLDQIPGVIVNDCKKKLPKIKFIFSIHGATPEIHDHVTKRSGSFNMMLASLDRFINAGITCEFNFVPMKVNIHQFTDIINIAKAFKIKKISVLRFVPQGRGDYNRNILELQGDEEKSFVRNLEQLRVSTEIAIRTGSPFNDIIPSNQIPCRAGSGKLVIQSDGNVLPCEVFKHYERCDWGLSVYEQTLSKILASSQIHNLRKNIVDRSTFSCPVHSNQKARFELGCNHEFVEIAVYAE